MQHFPGSRFNKKPNTLLCSKTHVLELLLFIISLIMRLLFIFVSVMLCRPNRASSAAALAFSFIPGELRRCVHEEVIRLNDMPGARKGKMPRRGRGKKQRRSCVCSCSVWIIHLLDRSPRTALETDMSRCWVKTEDRVMKADVKQGPAVREPAKDALPPCAKKKKRERKNILGKQKSQTGQRNSD